MTTRLSKTYKRWDVVRVAFPFADGPMTKRRPAVILSINHFNDHKNVYVLGMITTAKHSPWPLDVIIKDYEQAGLLRPSIIRLKLFTLDRRLLDGRIGTLSNRDRASATKSLARLFWTY